MSEENVEIIRRGWEHWVATGEIRAHADFVWDVSHLRWPDQQIYLGGEGAMQFLAEWADAWDEWVLEVEEYIDAGERVVAIASQRGRSRASGIPVEMRFAQVWTLRDGQGIRMEMYASPDEALEAVGLREEAMSQQHVEIARAALTAVRDLDRRAAAALFTPDAQWHNTSSFPGPRVCVGPDAIIDFWVTLTEDFEDFGDEIEQVLDVDGRVVVGFHQWGSGRQSGLPFDLRYAAIIELEDQHVVRVDIHGEFAKALEAVGLRE